MTLVHSDRASAHALRVQHARRREPPAGSRDRRARAPHARARAHRPRRDARLRGVLQGGAQAGREADPRLRGLRDGRQPLGPHADVLRRRGKPPPGAARSRRGGLPEPDEAHVARLPGGLLLPAPHRPRAARAALRGSPRLDGVPEGRGALALARREGGAGARDARLLPEILQGSRLVGSAGPRHRGRAARDPHAATSRSGPAPARGHERLPLHHGGSGGVAGPAHLHRHWQGIDDPKRFRMARRSCFQERGRDEATLRRDSGSGHQHDRGRGALQRRAGAGPVEDAGVPCRKAWRARTNTSDLARAKDWRALSRGHGGALERLAQ